jgi:hypothetical protein
MNYRRALHNASIWKLPDRLCAILRLLRKHCEGRHEARCHVISVARPFGLKHAQLRAELHRRLCQFDAGVEVAFEVRPANKSSTRGDGM